MSMNGRMNQDDEQGMMPITNENSTRWHSSSVEQRNQQNGGSTNNSNNVGSYNDGNTDQERDHDSGEEAESKERRESIKRIMKDPNLTSEQRRFSLQLLMDGRRRSSFGQTFAEAARNVAAEFAEDEDTNGSSNSNNATLSTSGDSEYGSSDVLAENPSTMVAYTLSGEPNGDPRQLEQNRPSCTHYRRNCSIISPCCGMVFSCRLCHNECQTLGIPFMNRLRQNNNSQVNKKQSCMANGCVATVPSTSISEEMNEKCQLRSISNRSNRSLHESSGDTQHEIDRFSISEVICRVCYTRQSSKANNCISCKVQFGEYHCSICNLWMDNEEKPYHCEGCGICRIGGKENFIHCDKCGMCIDKSIYNEHSCQVGKYMSKCPVCYEDLFSSRDACHELPCQHSIHWHCFCNLLSVDIRCPICKKTMLPDDEKGDIWMGLKEDIDAQPVPPDQTKVVDIFCNDCETREKSRRWHPLGVSCRHCAGFNTTIDVTMVGTEAFDFLARLERENNSAERK